MSRFLPIWPQEQWSLLLSKPDGNLDPQTMVSLPIPIVAIVVSGGVSKTRSVARSFLEIAQLALSLARLLDVQI